MMRMSGLLAAAVALAGCIGQNEVVFVTNTNIGINFDSKPPVLNIGYDREEGYIGPVHENGSLPPVIAKLESNLGVISPKIEQTYATGKAAVNLTLDPQPAREYPMRGNTRRVAFAMTSAALGLHVGFSADSGIPDSMHLGYKRKELSLIPLVDNPTGDCHGAADSGQAKDAVCYGSVLAQIKLDNTISDVTNTSVKLQQVFATGVAAENLAASDKATREVFAEKLNIAPVEVTCDDNCRKIRLFASQSPANSDAVKDKCQQASGAKLRSELYYKPAFQAARATCVRTLGI